MFACGASLAVSGSLTFWPIHQWYDFYIPILLYSIGYLIGLSLVWSFVWAIGRFGVNEKKEYDSVNKFDRWVLIQGMDYIVNHSLVYTSVINRRKMPKHGRFLFVSNHRSMYDSFIINQKFPRQDIAFITKSENMKVPLAHPLMWRLFYLPIDRDDYLQSLEVMKKAMSLTSCGATSIGVFPEGTRSKDGRVGPFHEGVFNMAIKGHLPIVIGSIRNTENIHKRFPFRFTHVYLEIVGVIPYEEIEDKPAKEVSEIVYQLINESLLKKPS